MNRGLIINGRLTNGSIAMKRGQKSLEDRGIPCWPSNDSGRVLYDLASRNLCLQRQARATVEAAPQAKNLVWEVMSDQWYLEANPDGYLSVGTTEDELMHAELRRYITDDPSISVLPCILARLERKVPELYLNETAGL